MSLNVSANHALQLVKEARRFAKAEAPPSYPQEQVRTVLREIQVLFSEAQAILAAGYSPSDAPIITKLLFLHLAIKRNKRCLLAYHKARLTHLLGRLQTSDLGPSRSTTLTGSMAETSQRTVAEEAFLKKYTVSLETYRRHFPELAIFSTSSRVPPRHLFVQIQVVQECGTIQTEHGTLSLPLHALLYVKLSDVQHLVDRGSVVVLS